MIKQEYIRPGIGIWQVEPGKLLIGSQVDPDNNREISGWPRGLVLPGSGRGSKH